MCIREHVVDGQKQDWPRKTDGCYSQLTGNTDWTSCERSTAISNWVGLVAVFGYSSRLCVQCCSM
jgi:hypothetical protein